MPAAPPAVHLLAQLPQQCFSDDSPDRSWGVLGCACVCPCLPDPALPSISCPSRAAAMFPAPTYHQLPSCCTPDHSLPVAPHPRRDYFNEEPFLRKLLEVHDAAVEMKRRDFLAGEGGAGGRHVLACAIHGSGTGIVQVEGWLR